MKRPIAIAVLAGNNVTIDRRTRPIFREEDFRGLNLQEVIWLRAPNNKERHAANRRVAATDGYQYLAEPITFEHFVDWLLLSLPALSADELRKVIAASTAQLLNPS